MDSLISSYRMRTFPGKLRIKSICAAALVTALLFPAHLSAMSRKAAVHISHPVVDKVAGNVVVLGRGQTEWEPVAGGTLLLSGDVIRTGMSGRATIRFASGQIELFENSEIVIPTIGNQERKKDIKELAIIKGSVFLDIKVDRRIGVFSFKSGNLNGQATRSLLTVSKRATETVVKVYNGDAQVSQAIGPGEKITSLVPGTSLKVQKTSSSGELGRFDPRLVLESYRKGTIPNPEITLYHYETAADVNNGSQKENLQAGLVKNRPGEY